LNKKIDVIQSLDLTRKAPVELLDDISRLTVEKRMWLTGLKEKAGKIEVVGIAVDNPTVAEYMTRIEASQKYIGVKLLSINQDDSIKGLNLKSFGISFQKKPATKQAK
jgi:type IV pilus assembly protein PilN